MILLYDNQPVFHNKLSNDRASAIYSKGVFIISVKKLTEADRGLYRCQFTTVENQQQSASLFLGSPKGLTVFIIYSIFYPITLKMNISNRKNLLYNKNIKCKKIPIDKLLFFYYSLFG